MDKRLFWRAALVFAAVVAIEAGILIALPLGDDFFEVLSWRVLTGHEVKPEGDSEATVKLRARDVLVLPDQDGQLVTLLAQHLGATT